MSFDSGHSLSLMGRSNTLSGSTLNTWNIWDELTSRTNLEDLYQFSRSSSSPGVTLAESSGALHSMSARSQMDIPDLAGNTLETARSMALGLAPSTFTDSVGFADVNDYYCFSLAEPSNFNLALTGLSHDVDVELQTGSSALGHSVHAGTADESINQTLDAGTYYIKVAAFDGHSNYTLRLSITSQSPAPSPSNILPAELDLGELGPTPISSTNSIANTDTADVYRFNFTGGDLNLVLSGLGADADMRLIRDSNSDGIVNDGEEIARSQRGGSSDESINLTSLTAGGYFVQVYQYSGSTNYTLNLSTTTAVTPTDSTGNTLATARDIGVLNAQQAFSDFVGTPDPNDYYRFSVDTTSSLTLLLGGLSADADVQLLNSSGELIVSSTASGSASETINRAIAAGTYYIRVYQYSGNTNYNFNVAASTIILPPNYNSSYGYGLVDASAAVAQAIGQTPFAAVSDLGGNSWDLDAINASEVWSQGYTGQGVVVAVVDSGVDYIHSDLDANIWTNTREVVGNGIDDDSNGYIDDVRGWDFVDDDNTPMDLYQHGTHVAGTIAAENNGVGVTGVAYNTRIMPVRVLDANGSGSNSDVAAGIRYAVASGADIINLSLGGSGSAQIAAAIQYAIEQGVLVVMAAGNEHESQPSFPANLADKFGIAVGAVDSSNNLANFSNRAGLSTVNYVVAPGVSVYSTTPNNSYTNLNGTSMATPHVAGVAALILSANPDLTPAQVVSLLTDTANSTGVTAV